MISEPSDRLNPSGSLLPGKSAASAAVSSSKRPETTNSGCSELMIAFRRERLSSTIARCRTGNYADTFTPYGSDCAFGKQACYACHTAVAAKDYIFTAYPRGNRGWVKS